MCLITCIYLIPKLLYLRFVFFEPNDYQTSTLNQTRTTTKTICNFSTRFSAPPDQTLTADDTINIHNSPGLSYGVEEEKSNAHPKRDSTKGNPGGSPTTCSTSSSFVPRSSTSSASRSSSTDDDFILVSAPDHPA